MKAKKFTKSKRAQHKKPVPITESSTFGDRGVGFISQITDAGAQVFSGDCGAASLHMVLQPFGFVANRTVDELQRAMGPCVGNAIHDLSNWDEIVCVGNQMGATMETAIGNLRHGDIALIDYGKISNRVDQHYTGLHWLVVVADWGETIECNDPDSRGEGSKGALYSKAEFMTAYLACGNRYVRCRNLDQGQMEVRSEDRFVRLRQGPSLTADVVAELPNGTHVFADELTGFFTRSEPSMERDMLMRPIFLLCLVDP